VLRVLKTLRIEKSEARNPKQFRKTNLEIQNKGQALCGAMLPHAVRGSMLPHVEYDSVVVFLVIVLKFVL
jgi:hypothetical protein